MQRAICNPLALSNTVCRGALRWLLAARDGWGLVANAATARLRWGLRRLLQRRRTSVAPLLILGCTTCTPHAMGLIMRQGRTQSGRRTGPVARRDGDEVVLPIGVALGGGTEREGQQTSAREHLALGWPPPRSERNSSFRIKETNHGPLVVHPAVHGLSVRCPTSSKETRFVRKHATVRLLVRPTPTAPERARA
jgi:hypothetical protein